MRDNSAMTETGEIVDHKLQMLVLERRNASCNMARFYVLAIEPTLFAEMALVREGEVRGVVVASTSILTVPLPRNLSTIGWLERRGADIGSESHISCPDRRQAFMPDTCKGHRFRGKWRPMEQYQVLRKVARRKDCRETSAQEVEIEEVRS